MKIALIQAELVWGDVTANLWRFGEKIAVCRGCDLILLPEMFTSGCMMVKKAREEAMAEKRGVVMRFDEIRETMRAWALQSDAVVCGSTVYEAEGRYYNRLIVARPGEECLYYDKRHCCK